MSDDAEGAVDANDERIGAVPRVGEEGDDEEKMDVVDEYAGAPPTNDSNDTAAASTTYGNEDKIEKAAQRFYLTL